VSNIIGDLLVKLGIDTKGVEQGEKRANKSAKSIAKVMGALKVGAIAAGAATVAAVAFSINEYRKAEVVTARLAGLLKNMNGATKDTMKSFADMGNVIQDKSAFGNDEIVSAMTDVLQITKDYNVALASGQNIADFAAGANLDLSTSAMLLGRAYNGDTTMLKRYGVTLAEGVKGTEALAKIQTQFAGSAAKQLDTVSGRWTAMKNVIGDVAKTGGRELAPAIIIALKNIHAGFKSLEDSGAVASIADTLGRTAAVTIPAFVMTVKDMFKDINKAANENKGSKDPVGNAMQKLFGISAADMKKMNDGFSKGAAGPDLKDRSSFAQNYAKHLADLEAQYNNTKESISEFTQTLIEEDEALTADDEAKKKAIELQKEYEGTFNSTYGSMEGIIGDFYETVTDTELTANEKMAEILKMGLTAVLDAVGIQLQAYMLAETGKAIATGGLTAGTVVGMAAQIAAVEGLKAAVGSISLANGGIAYSPVNAVVGDNPHGPEVIAPLHELQPMIQQAVNSGNGGNVSYNAHVHVDNLQDPKKIMREQIAPAFKEFIIQHHGGKISRANGTPTF